MRKLFSFLTSRQIARCRRIAESASIEPLIEKCAYVGFSVQLHDSEFKTYLGRPEALTAFEQVIERRINEKDFSELYIHPVSNVLASDEGPRVVFNLDSSVIYHWRPNRLFKAPGNSLHSGIKD